MIKSKEYFPTSCQHCSIFQPLFFFTFSKLILMRPFGVNQSKNQPNIQIKFTSYFFSQSPTKQMLRRHMYSLKENKTDEKNEKFKNLRDTQFTKTNQSDSYIKTNETKKL